jgi:hypothetical protein
MPARQRTAASKTRRLKKADCEVDFFFRESVSVDETGQENFLRPEV